MKYEAVTNSLDALMKETPRVSVVTRFGTWDVFLERRTAYEKEYMDAGGTGMVVLHSPSNKSWKHTAVAVIFFFPSEGSKKTFTEHCIKMEGELQNKEDTIQGIAGMLLGEEEEDHEREEQE